MSATITINGSRVVAARFVMPWRGVAYVDLDVDPELVETVQAQIALKTPAALVLDGVPPTPFVGVFDPNASGTFVSSAQLRFVFGANGWEKEVHSQDFPQPITTQLLYGATGALVGEKVVVAIPLPLERFSRSHGPASRVFADDVEWWVDPLTGVTLVGPRPPAVPDPSLEILEWDPATNTAIVACDRLVMPGTPLVDKRIGGSPVTVRDVEHVFSSEGSRATCRCSEAPVTRFMSMMRSMVQELAGVTYLRLRRYRVVLGDDAKLALQAVDRDPLTQMGAPLPDMLAVNEWIGAPGFTAIPAPSLEVIVAFVDGDPKRPFVLSYSTLAPAVSIALKALLTLGLTAAEIDVTAALIKLAGAITLGGAVTFGAPIPGDMIILGTTAAGGGSPVAKASPLVTWAANVTSAVNALAPGSVTPLVDPSSATLMAG